MEFIVTLKQEPFEALLRCIRLYMEQDYCTCESMFELPLFQSDQGENCPPDCERCTWCSARKALRGIGQPVAGE